VREVVFGEERCCELRPGGGATPVTAANKAEYVRLYTHWVLAGSVAEQALLFRQGFALVMRGAALRLLRPAELELLCVGGRHLDFKKLEAGAGYGGGLSRGSATVRWLWAEVHALPLRLQQRFLHFVTGSQRAPIAGLESLGLQVHRAQDGPPRGAQPAAAADFANGRLPTAHTCFNLLVLPEYDSRQRLKGKLLLAIGECEGFGLA
jgi:hypothetical protein